MVHCKMSLFEPKGWAWRRSGTAVDGDIMNLFEKMHMLHRIHRFKRRKNREELAYIAKLPLEGSAVFDVGANKGAISYWLSKFVGAAGRVYSFEPQPELGQHLKAVKEIFALDNVTIVNKALSDEAGEKFLYRDQAGKGHATFDNQRDYLEKIKVPKITIDDFVRDHDIDNLTFVKLDVERHEFNVLKGGRETLRQQMPTLLFECHDEEYVSGNIFAFLLSLGYDGFCFIEGKAVHFSDRENIRRKPGHKDFFFLPRQQMPAIELTKS